MTSCPDCNTTFDPAKAPGGMCPRCLMMGGAEEETPTLPSQHGIAWSPTDAGEIDAAQQDYQIIEMIGRGGMGAVYRAWQPSLGRLVAVKVLPSETGMMGAQERFENEARVLGLLQHPNIMPVHEMGKDAEGRSFYAMKLVKGRTLQQVLNDLRQGDPQVVKQYPLAALLTVFEKICDALSFAHSQHVLHRDFKPDNIMVGEFGEVLVLDWGLAKVLNDEFRMTNEEGVAHSSFDVRHSAFGTTEWATLAGDVMGTPQFMSPEQAEGKIAEMDERSDVFSLGGVLYAILTLHPPVEGEDVHEVLQRVREGAITPPVMRPTEAAKAREGEAKGQVSPAKDLMGFLPHCPGGRVPAPLSAVAMKALQVDLTKRYQNVASLQADVAAYQRGFATSAEEASALRLMQLFILRHKAVASALLVLVLASIGFVIRVMQSERQAQASAQEARIAQVDAQASAKEARAAQAEAQEKREAERRSLAEAQVMLARAANREHDSPTMLSALQSVPADLRGMEWAYLEKCADNSTFSIAENGVTNFMGAAPHPTRPGFFATINREWGRFVLIDATIGVPSGGFDGTPRQRAVRYSCRSMDFSPDGRLLVTGRPAPAGACVYEVETGKPLGEWPPDSVVCTRFHPDGTRVLVVTEFSPHFILSLHNATTGARRWEKRNVHQAVFMPGGNIAASYGGSLSILSATDGAVIRTLTYASHSSRIHSIAVSPNGARFYLGGDDGWLRAIRAADGVTLYERMITEAASPVFVARSGDGRRIVVGANLESQGRIIRVIDADTGRTLQTLMGGSGAISELGMHPVTGDILVSGADTRVWSGARLLTVERTFFANQYSCTFWGSASEMINMGSLLTFPPAADAPPVESPLPLPFASKERVNWQVSAEGDLAAFSLTTTVPGGASSSALQILRREDGRYAPVSTATFPAIAQRVRLSPGGKYVAVTNGRQMLRIFDTATGATVCDCDLKEFKFGREIIWTDASHLAVIAGVSFDDRTNLLLWDAQTGRIAQRLKKKLRMMAIAPSPDGKTLAEGGFDQRVRLRDARTLEVRAEFIAHDASLTALAFHPSQPWLATAAQDRTVRLWDLRTLRILREIQPSSSAVDSLTFSPDGAVLACADRAFFTHLVRMTAE